MYHSDNFFKLLLLFLIGGVISCNSVYKIVNGVNSKVNFNTKIEYCNIIKNKYNIDTSQMIFIDNVDKTELMFALRDENVSFFYGVILDLNYKIQDEYLQDSNNCIGRVFSLIESDLNKNNYKTINTNIATFNYFNKNDKKVLINDKKLIMFIFSTKIGRQNINKIKEFIYKYKTNNKYKGYRYYLISID